ncbi:hypothetical protein F5Y05DRAFT_409683 [Hypoxylon sp. FL0543]|nr:hypothetical protein F5Y05DRAFT_409683 [Hypoxylon sp. FL0543]
MVAPMSTLPTNQRPDNVAVHEQTFREGAREFTCFTQLPKEIQLMIWEITLPPAPTARVLSPDQNAALWPVYEAPKGWSHGHTKASLLRSLPLPRPGVVPVALHVCQASRNLALESFVPVPVQGNPNLGYHFVGIDDIVDINSPALPVDDLLKTRKRHTEDQVDKLKRLVASMRLPKNNRDVFTVQGEKLLYDIGSSRLCMVIRQDPRRDFWWPAWLPRPQMPYVALRFSSDEEWLFGSRITIGHVPEYLRRNLGEDPEKWTKFVPHAIKDKPHPGGELWCWNSSPLGILGAHIWMLHKIAYCDTDNPSINTRCCFQYGDVIRAFIDIMDGRSCPGCHCALITRIKTRYPDLPLEDLGIFFILPRPGFQSLLDYGRFTHMKFF